MVGVRRLTGWSPHFPHIPLRYARVFHLSPISSGSIPSHPAEPGPPGVVRRGEPDEMRWEGSCRRVVSYPLTSYPSHRSLPFRSERRTKRATSEGRKDVKRKEPTGPVSSRHFPSLLTPYPPEAPLRGSDGVTRRRERAETRWPERGAGMEWMRDEVTREKRRASTPSTLTLPHLIHLIPSIRVPFARRVRVAEGHGDGME